MNMMRPILEIAAGIFIALALLTGPAMADATALEIEDKCLAAARIAQQRAYPEPGDREKAATCFLYGVGLYDGAAALLDLIDDRVFLCWRPEDFGLVLHAWIYLKKFEADTGLHQQNNIALIMALMIEFPCD